MEMGAPRRASSRLDVTTWASLEVRFEELIRNAGLGARAPRPLGAPVDGAGAWRMDDDALLAELQDAHVDVARTQARWLGLLAEVERRAACVNVHSLPAASWLAAGTSHSARAARADVRLASLLSEFTAVASALAEGAVSLEQAASVCHGLDKLPDRLDADQRRAVEEHMVELAAEFNPTALRRLVNHAVEVVAPEVVEEHLRHAQERAEREQARGRHVGWRTDPDDGSLRFWGKLPAAEGELLKQHLSALASSLRVADAALGVETSQGQALADALALVVGHHASCDGGPVKGGDHTRVVVTLSLDELLSGVGTGTLVESGEPISATQARRLACTAGIIPLVLNGDSVPLDLGRSQRLFSPAQRISLAVRDGGCSFPGCDRPPADCEAHHAVTPWHAGGRTDLHEGVLVCTHHHHVVEPDLSKPPESNWQITFDERGKPVFHSPADRHGHRVTRQHHRYRIMLQ